MKHDERTTGLLPKYLKKKTVTVSLYCLLAPNSFFNTFSVILVEFCKAFLLLSEHDGKLSQEKAWKDIAGRRASLGSGHSRAGQ